MKTKFTLALIGVIAFYANAAELLQAYPSSGVEIHATDNMLKINAEGPNIRFFLKDKDMFVSAFVFKDTRNPYPLLNEFSERFLKSTYSSNDYQVFFKERVESGFANKKTDGMRYLVDLNDGNCELYLANSVGNQAYIFVTISNEVTRAKCGNLGDRLNSAAAQITASITVKDI